MEEVPALSKVGVGMSSLEVILAIKASNPDILAMSFRAFVPRTRSVTARLMLGEEVSLGEALESKAHQDPVTWLLRKEVTRYSLSEMVLRLPLGGGLAFSSKAKVQASSQRVVFRHIPLMDFACLSNKENLEEIRKFLLEIGEQGAILSSGNSYHFYGMRPISWANLTKTLVSKSLLFFGNADRRYIGHQLGQQEMNLRISPKGGCFPKVVAVV